MIRSSDDFCQFVDHAFFSLNNEYRKARRAGNENGQKNALIKMSKINRILEETVAELKKVGFGNI